MTKHVIAHTRLTRLLLLLALLFASLVGLVPPTAQAATPGAAVAWGRNNYGQSSVPTTLSGVTAIAGGAAHSLALKSDGTVVAWGNNASGQLNIPADLSGVTAITAGTRHSLALKSDGTVVAWGDNTYGQLNIPAGLNGVIAIESGANHSLALKSDGTVVAWGDNAFGQLSVPATSGVTAIAAGAYHNLALKSDGTVVASGHNGLGQLNVPANLGGVTAIAVGYQHSLALKSDGTVVAWGDNFYGQLNVPTNFSNVTAIAAGHFHNLALKSDGTVVASGDNDFGQLNVPATLSGVIAIAAGGGHSLALERDTSAPSVTLNQAAAQADPTTSTAVLFTAHFSEPVSGVTASDVTLGGTTTLTGATVAVSGGPSVYTISVSGLAGNGTLSATLAANVASDAAGNGNTASTSTDNSVTFTADSTPPDSTPPVITPTVVGTLGTNGWYTSNVAVSWSVVDNESTISTPTGCDAQTVSSDTAGVTYTCTATSAGGTTDQSVTIKRDATAPTITFADRTAPNAAGWNNSAVTVNWTCSDAPSGATSAGASQTRSSEGANQSATGTCTDQAGNTASASQTGINIDTTAPTLAPVVNPNPVLLNGSATATPNAADALSGLASQSCDTVTASSIGTHTLPCSATDIAGNAGSTNVTYQVIGAWSGFLQSVDNLPMVNMVRAKKGLAISVIFSLSGDQGMNIFAAGYPTSQPVACSSGAAVDEIEQTVRARASSLVYDEATDTYTYVWPIEKQWAGTCRQLIVRFQDGTEHSAAFQFK